MDLLLLAVGKLRRECRSLCDDYFQRLGRFQPISEREVKEAGRAGSVPLQLRAEGERILKHIPREAGVTLLDPAGKNWSSEELAEQLDRWRVEHRPRVLIIGGAAGVAEVVRQRADSHWSLGRATLAHELARVVVAEQLYRASTILRGEPYHKGS